MKRRNSIVEFICRKLIKSQTMTRYHQNHLEQGRSQNGVCEHSAHTWKKIEQWKSNYSPQGLKLQNRLHFRIIHCQRIKFNRIFFLFFDYVILKMGFLQRMFLFHRHLLIFHHDIYLIFLCDFRKSSACLLHCN